MNLKKAYKKISWNLFYVIFRLFPKIGKYSSLPVIGPSIKRMVNLDPSELTQAYVLNLNMDITEKAKNVVLPISMIKQMVKESDYLAIMNVCLCRTAYKCKNFPHDHACIFIGKEAKAIVDKHLGHEASIEDVLSHIDRGSELGLVGHAMWIEVEGYLFGIKREKGVAHWLEICFCCPCCCSAFKLIKATNQMDIKSRFRSISWNHILTIINVLCVKSVLPNARWEPYLAEITGSLLMKNYAWAAGSVLQNAKGSDKASS